MLARDLLAAGGVALDYMRVRALPLAPSVVEFIERHERVYVVEQNRDGQLYGILRTELPAHLVGRLLSVCHYNGVPIDALAVVEPLRSAERSFDSATGPAQSARSAVEGLRMTKAV